MTNPYLQRLKRDQATTWAVSAALFGIMPLMGGIVTILLPAPHIDLQVNPLYWLILLIPVPWFWKLFGYEAGALRTVKPMLWGTPIAACLVAAVAWALRLDLEPYLWMVAVTVAICAIGLIAYP